MGALYSYDPNKIHVTIVGPTMVVPRVSGYAPGTSIRVAQASSRFAMVAGVRGQVARYRQSSRAGQIGFVLEERSHVNTLLQALHSADDALQVGLVAIMVVDEHGLDVAIASQAWIVGRPEWLKGNGPGVKAWVFDCAHLEMQNGGGIPARVPADRGDIAF